MTIRWLHLSDIHECERNEHNRKAMYESIVEEVKTRDAQDAPHFVFLTGDLTFSGKACEYERLKEELVTPLKKALPDTCRIYCVPGNHDVDREAGVNPRLWITSESDRNAFNDVGEAGRRKRRDMLLPRFEAYDQFEGNISNWSEKWIDSKSGSICDIVSVENHKLAIIGINTAWMCHDDDDWGKLTAGQMLVDAAIKKADAEGVDLKSVLGHHPLSAMEGEQLWSDGNGIRQTLERSKAIYLHGHLHKSGNQTTGDSMQSVLAIQAPSAFQAANSDIWRNGIMWGAVNLQSGEVLIEPKLWSNKHGEYKFDLDAARNDLRVRGKDAFRFAIPGWQATSTHSSGLASPQPARTSHEPPEGWEIVDKATLAAKTATPPCVEEMKDWFNGMFPRWEVVTAKGVCPRQLVDNLVRRYRTAYGNSPQPIIELLTGAGGEGKSAVLLQTVAGLVRSDQNWSCLSRLSLSADLPAEFANLLPRRDDHAWIIAIDDAENVVDGLPDLLRKLQPRTDVHLILASRDADLNLRGYSDQIWDRVADFGRQTLAGLDEEDANRIVQSWSAFGSRAMGNLWSMTTKKAARALLGHAQELAARQEEGALLGALLIAREGEELRNRVVRLMSPWRDAPGIKDKTLLDIYARIAAMHAENQLYLSRTVLAFALDCSEKELEHGPLRILRREAMISGGTAYILTRHRQIAEVACKWLSEEGYDLDRVFPELARAAIAEQKENRSQNPDLASWRFDLTRRFVEKGAEKWEVACSISKAVFDYDPDNLHYLTNYTGTLRRTKQSGRALQLFREYSDQCASHRGSLHEWSVVVREIGDPGLSAWIAAKSISDMQSMLISRKDAKLALSSLETAFRKLAESNNQRYFSRAQAVCGRLGLRVHDGDGDATSDFEDLIPTDPNTPENTPTVADDLATLSQAVIRASNEANPENKPTFYEEKIGEPDVYRFSTLQDLLVSCEMEGER